MKTTDIYFQTIRGKIKGADTVSSKLLLKGGFVYQVASGVYSFLPLGYLVLQKLIKIIQEELAKAGAIEMLLPVVQPASLWKESGRYDEIGEELLSFKNRFGEEFVLSFTGEELFTKIAQHKIKSYRDLPLILNQINTKYRDEVRPKGGLIRLREFIMQDAYSFDADDPGMKISHDKIFEAYRRILKRCCLPAIPVLAETGTMGGIASYEWVVKSPAGEAEIINCPKCKYASNVDLAEKMTSPVKEMVSSKKEKKEKVKTTGMKTALEVAEYLRVDSAQVIKTMIYWADGKLVMVLVRGDMSINDNKLAKVLPVKELRLAKNSELEQAGLIAGYASPVGLKKKYKVIADYAIKLGQYYIVGANVRDCHYKGVKISELGVSKWAELAKVKVGDLCVKCGTPLKSYKAIELAHTFQLGQRYSKARKATYLKKSGESEYFWMGSYGIGLDRLMAAIVEINHDKDGICWPAEVAPFDIYIADLGNDAKIKEQAEKIYCDLKKAGLDVLYDNRAETIGVKLNDADLIGVPIRLIVSSKTIAQNSIEMKIRKQTKTKLIPIDKIKKELAK